MAAPIVGATFWLVNQPSAGVSGRYFGITPSLYLPWGNYDRHDALNLGENRLKGDMQLGWVEPLWGRFSMELYGDAVFYLTTYIPPAVFRKMLASTTARCWYFELDAGERQVYLR